MANWDNFTFTNPRESAATVQAYIDKYNEMGQPVPQDLLDQSAAARRQEREVGTSTNTDSAGYGGQWKSGTNPNREVPEQTTFTDAWANNGSNNYQSEYDEQVALQGQAYIYSAFPWVEQMGIGAQLREWLIEGLEGTALLGKLRQLPQYQAYFPWIRRDDGTMRMTEAEYLRSQQGYGVLLRQYGHEVPTDPQGFGHFFNGEVSQDELKDRLETYSNVQRSGRSVKEAFYIYAGIRLTDDQLYDALIQPERMQQLQSEYNIRVASSPLNYDTWADRATEVGLQRVVDTLEKLEGAGVITSTAIERVRSVNPEFAKQMIATLYTGGDPNAGDYMTNIDDIMATFEEAMIGGAATAAGFTLPGRERVQELRQAGVSRAQALQKYSDFGADSRRISAAAGRRGDTFGVRDFEEASMLGAGDERARLDQILAQEKAMGQASGGIAVRREEHGLEQAGFQSFRT